MNITLNTQELATELRLLSKIVASKPSLPILSHVLLKADTGLTLYATDLELGLRTVCPCRVDTPGTLALPLAKLASVIDQLPNADVNISLDGKQAKITSGAYKSRLQALPADEFPALPEVEGVSSYLDARAFRQMIDRTRYAIAATGDRYLLQGALLTLAGPAAAMVATDGKRLALTTMARAGTDANVIIPVKTLDVLSSHAGAEDIELTVGENHLFFVQGTRLLTSRVIDGKFPNYQRIIPKDNHKTATVDRAALAAVLRRIGLASEQNLSVTMAFSSGELLVSSRSAEFGEAEEPMTITYDAEPLTLCVNWRYVLDFLDAAEGQTISIAMKDEKSALLLSDGEAFVNVIMTMRS